MLFLKLPHHATGIFLLVALSLAACISTNYTDPIPEKAVPLLLKILKNPNPQQRQTAAQSLGKIGRKEALPALIEALQDPDPGVRRQAAWSLGVIGDNSNTARLSLISLLFDPAQNVREAAAFALAQTGDAETGLAVLQDRLFAPGSSNDTKRLAAAALGGMGIHASTGIASRLLQDQNPIVRRWAVAALAEIDSREALAPLSRLLRHDPDSRVRLEAAFRLGRLAGPAATAALTAALNDSDEDVRRIATAALKEAVQTY